MPPTATTILDTYTPDRQPFLPTPNPDSDESFLTIEFCPTAPPDFDPSGLPLSGIEYRIDDTHVAYKDKHGYETIELTPTAYRYTVSVPSLQFTMFGDYVDTAQERLRDALPHPGCECYLRFYLIGNQAAHQADDAGIVDYATTQLGADTTEIEEFSADTNGVIVFTPYPPTPYPL